MHRHKQRTVTQALPPILSGLQAAISALLLIGLSGCGQASPDLTGQATPNAPSKPTVTATPSQQNRALNIDTGASRHSPPAPERMSTNSRSQPPTSPAALRPASADNDPATVARQQWFAEARVHPDVTVRRQALELWTEQPSQNLDPLTYALVDEDESVRTRAQELYEQQLAREATAAPGDGIDAQHPHHAE